VTPEERAQRILYRAKNTPSEYTTWDSFRDSVRDDLRAAEAEARREEWGGRAPSWPRQWTQNSLGETRSPRPSVRGGAMRRSVHEVLFASFLRDADAPEWKEEFPFCEWRRYRWDFAWPLLAVAVEIQGGEWSSGEHARGGGMAKDAMKLDLAVLLGWRVIVLTGSMVQRHGRELARGVAALVAGDTDAARLLFTEVGSRMLVEQRRKT